ncbi:hypothetical protein BJX76DRAFT_361303 [Aspergillus varians]
MAAQISFKKLVDEMKTKKTTNGYDVLVAYSETKVNELLHARADSLNGHLSPESLNLDIKLWDRRRQEFYHMIVKLNVKRPVLEFQDNSEVHLIYDVESGSTQIDNLKEQPLPNGLIVVLKAKLCNVSGTVDADGEFKVTTNAEGQPVDMKPAEHNVVLNPDHQDAAQGICIDMSGVTADVKSKPGTGQEAKDAVSDLDGIGADIANYFKGAASVKYYLAGVSNTHVPELGAHVLRPTSFNFTIAKGKDGDSALCMWIGVIHGANNGSASATFQPSEENRIPIPTGSTASVIIHHDVLWELFLKPNLEKHFPDLEALPTTPEESYRAEATLNVPDYYQPKEQKVEMVLIYLNQRIRDEIKFSPKDTKSIFTMSREIATNSPTAAAFTYKSPEQIVYWSWTWGGNPPEEDTGTAYLTFTWAARARWTNATDGAHPNTINLEWENDKKWTISGGGTRQTNNGWNIFNTKLMKDYVPPDLRSSDVPTPEVKLPMDSLDYFLTTNLLCPGKHMFKADTIGSAETNGLAVPCDLIIAGDIDTSVD